MASEMDPGEGGPGPSAGPSWTREPGLDPDPASGSIAGMEPDLTGHISSILGAVEREAGRLLEDARVEAQKQVDLARRQADGLVAERQRRLSELSDGLVKRVESLLARLDETAPIQESFEQLLRALGQAADQLALEIEAPHAPQAPEATDPPPREPAPGPPPAPRAIEPDAGEAAEERAHVRHLRPRRPPPEAPAASTDDDGAPGEDRGPSKPTGEDADSVQRARQAAIQMAAAGATRARVAAHLRGSLGFAEPTPLLDEIFGPGSPG